jgi:enamine deaminase RidA (YjgF/YER057c/UK114 family)
MEAVLQMCASRQNSVLPTSTRSCIRLSAFVTDRAFFPDYMAVRDEWLAGVAILPASTLLVVSGFTREEFKVEIEATAIQRN